LAPYWEKRIESRFKSQSRFRIHVPHHPSRVIRFSLFMLGTLPGGCQGLCQETTSQGFVVAHLSEDTAQDSTK